MAPSRSKEDEWKAAIRLQRRASETRRESFRNRAEEASLHAGVMEVSIKFLSEDGEAASPEVLRRAILESTNEVSVEAIMATLGFTASADDAPAAIPPVAEEEEDDGGDGDEASDMELEDIAETPPPALPPPLPPPALPPPPPPARDAVVLRVGLPGGGGAGRVYRVTEGPEHGDLFEDAGASRRIAYGGLVGAPSLLAAPFAYYRPRAGFVGSDAFRYKYRSEAGAWSEEQTVAVDVDLRRRPSLDDLTAEDLERIATAPDGHQAALFVGNKRLNRPST